MRLTEAQAFAREVLAGRDPGPLPAAGTDRDEVLDLLRRHRLLGLWWSESGAAAAAADAADPAGEDVRARVALQALRTDLTLDAAQRARTALGEGGFEVLVFKGAGLIRAGVYPDARARALGDADLLVRGGQVEEAVRRLEAVGFTPWVPWDPGRLAWLPAFTLSDARAPDGIDVTIDLHWRIPYGSYRSGDEGGAEEIWVGADPDAGVPSAEAHALLLAEHFVRHLRVVPHLVGLADLVRLLPRIEDPERLRHLAGRRRALRPLRAVLWLLRSALDVPVDPRLAAALEVPERLGWPASSALRLDRLMEVRGGRRDARVSGLVRQAFLQGSPGDFVREVARVVYPPAEWLARRAGPGAGGAVRRRLGYWWTLMRWGLGRRASPLSPNQEFEDPGGRR